jgi:hypothetical protein
MQKDNFILVSEYTKHGPSQVSQRTESIALEQKSIIFFRWTSQIQFTTMELHYSMFFLFQKTHTLKHRGHEYDAQSLEMMANSFGIFDDIKQ